MWLEILGTIFSLNTFEAAIRLAVPIALAAMGGTFSERAGIINIGLEGMLLTGAFAAVLGSYFTGSAWLGVAFAVLASAMSAALFGYFTIELKANHVVAGVGLNILALGLTTWLMQVFWGSRGTSPAVTGVGRLHIPFIAELPIIGRLLGRQSPFVYIMFILIIGGWVLLFKTPLGLRIRMTGEHPEAADSLGIKIRFIKHFSVILGGAFCGFGGAYLSLGNLNWFSMNMSAGRGYMALAANIFGQWNPLGGLGASFLFSFSDAVQMRLQGLDIALPHNIIQMIPFVLTIVILAGAVVKARPPAALGNHYSPGK
ncbi:MAG: ABC transporter permease [Spirochaetaceae bacterium]|nr:MAG: ABC transporter permease [Spirochaetaceae bacterium]